MNKFKVWTIAAIIVNALIVLLAVGDVFSGVSPAIRWLLSPLALGVTFMAYKAYAAEEPIVYRRALPIIILFSIGVQYAIWFGGIYKGM